MSSPFKGMDPSASFQRTPFMIHQALRTQYAPLPPLDQYGYNSRGELINQLDPIIYPAKKKPGQSQVKE